MPTARHNVYTVIDSEREYQDLKYGDTPHEVGGWLTIMRHLLLRAEDAWVDGKDDIEALAEIRKVAATAVACMEQHGCTFRSLPVVGE